MNGVHRRRYFRSVSLRSRTALNSEPFSQHHRLEILEQGRVEKRLFQRWHMGFATAPQTLVQQLSQSQWRREIPWLEDESAASSGLTRLLAFWKEEAVLAH